MIEVELPTAFTFTTCICSEYCRPYLNYFLSIYIFAHLIIYKQTYNITEDVVIFVKLIDLLLIPIGYYGSYIYRGYYNNSIGSSLLMTITQVEVYLCTCYRLVIYEVGLHMIVGIVRRRYCELSTFTYHILEYFMLTQTVRQIVLFWQHSWHNEIG